MGFMVNPYETLGIAMTASANDIKITYGGWRNSGIQT